ncbi:MAG TPA: GntR family transcriptional regulator [Aestuariivirgaceae bacterium]|nr:GntR family transcriptional regulator [Aestuariivirgaceae bacterium]
MSSRSLHAEVKHRIIGSLSEGRWKHGEAIPSEQALARRFKVSVGTVRRAVSELVVESVLVRRQGSGTYVASHTRDYMLSVFFWIVDEKDRKELPRVEVLSYRRARADAATAARLRLQPGAPVIRVRALQRIGGRPMMVDDMRMPQALFPALTEPMFRGREGTIYGFFQERFGITVVRVVERLQARAAGASVAAALGLPAGAAVLRIERTAYTYRDVPVETRIRHVNTARLAYLSQLGRH